MFRLPPGWTPGPFRPLLDEMAPVAAHRGYFPAMNPFRLAAIARTLGLLPPGYSQLPGLRPYADVQPAASPIFDSRQPHPGYVALERLIRSTRSAPTAGMSRLAE